MFKKTKHFLLFSLLIVFISLKYANAVNNKNFLNSTNSPKENAFNQLQTSSGKIKDEKKKRAKKTQAATIKDKKEIIPSKKPNNIKETATIAEKEKAQNARIAAKKALEQKRTKIISKPAHKIFGSIEIKREGLKLFPKWLQVLEKNQKEKKKALQEKTERTIEIYEDCRYDENPLCLYLDKGKYKKWNTFLKDIKNDSKAEQLDKINTFANQNIYIPDHINWGIEDYWASPGEFLRRSGDCEDYAITKYMSLIELGWDMNDLRVIVLEDTSLNLIHVVLAVYQNGKVNILDNQHENVIEDTRIKHYKPIFAVNEKMWWRYY